MQGTLIFSISEGVVILLQLIVMLPVTIAIISLLVHQLNCILSGMTSIESFLFHRYQKGLKRKGETKVYFFLHLLKVYNFLKNLFLYQKLSWFYDYGWKDNLKQILGPNLHWCWYPEIPKHVLEYDPEVWKVQFN